ncbi:tetratricopeptide repeat protein [Oceanobacillus rekensis]|uniref:tetratricopeptide repeat protein n=1 Tax=Oceanobacillus rekensis TaxID=937927 RepID=UPI000B437FFF|nr:hypothetical protein [Oceanobacillus rekensis]
MSINQFQIRVNKKELTLTAEQLVFYKQSKVLEATDQNKNHYYLIFYKNDFINGAKSKHIKINSYIHHAFTKGIHFKGSHPITTQVLRNKTTFHLIPFNQLFKNIQKSYPKLETALIISYFDSFTKSGSVENLFKRTYYDYRRNGQNLTAYKLLKTFINVGCESKFAHDMMNDMQLSKYRGLYEKMLDVYEKDPINFEAASFDVLCNNKSTELLFQLYKEQDRPLDELAVRTAMLRSKFSKSNFEAILTNINHLPIIDKILFLQEFKPNTSINKELMNIIMNAGDANQMTEFLMSTKLLVPDEQLEMTIHSFENTDATLLSTYFSKSNKRLLKLSKNNAYTMEKMIKPFVSAFLDGYPLSDILDWFKPFHDAGHQLPIERKLLKMKKMMEDPDQQFELGELYVQFRQYEKSIDCFKWEMELNPEDRKPITHLSKVYLELGDKEEAAAYQQLLIQMSK